MGRPVFPSRRQAGLLIAGALALTAGSGRIARAQAAAPTADAPAADSAGVADVIVTANRRSERQREVANSVTAITGEQLDERNEVRIQDLVGQVPGLAVQDASPTQTRIILRGLNAGGTGALVASVVDDVPTNTAGAQNFAATVTPNFDTYDLQRIEVLRGPQSSLYGATAEGGLIKYVTNAPDPSRYSGEFEGGLNGLTAGGIGGSLKGFVNLPLVEDVAALRLTASSQWLPGYIDNPQRGKTDVNSGQQYSWRASLLIKPNEDLTVRLTASRQSVFVNGTSSVEAIGAARTPAAPPAGQLDLISPLQFGTRLPTNRQLESGYYYADVEYHAGRATLTSLTSYAIVDSKVEDDLTDSDLVPGVSLGAGLGGAVYRQPVTLSSLANSNTGKFNQEVRVSSDPGSTLFGYGFDWQGGVFYTHETEVIGQVLDARPLKGPSAILAPPFGGSHGTGSYAEWGVFGQVTLHPTESVSVDIGGRVSGNDQHSQSVNTCCVAFGPSLTAPERSSNDHDALYAVAPKWRIDDDTLAYARIATGYRPGGPNALFANTPNAPSQYRSDRAIDYEAGLRRDFLDKKIQVDVTGFYLDWKQIQITSVFQSATGQLNIPGNGGTATSKGVEWSLAWRPATGLTLTAVGGFADARLTEDAPGIGGRNGQYLPYVPDVTSSLNADYRWDLSDDLLGYLSGTWTYVGARYTDFSVATTAASHVLLPSYNTGSLRAGLEKGRYAAEAFIDNISDERGIATYRNNGGPGQTGLETLIQPRLIGAMLKVRF